INSYFKAVTSLFKMHTFTSDRIYNVDKTAFNIRSNQSTRALVSIRISTKVRAVLPRSELLTCLKYVSASSKALL
ncbi:hypothetical protein K431DRAFT_217517, partial [Polychaeton citri CBS 116435]